MKNLYDIAVVGATGAVGAMLLTILEERQFPVNRIYLLASKKSAGETLDFNGSPQVIEDLSTFDFSRAQLSFFCANNDIAAEYAPKAAAAGSIVIDKSSYFRYNDDVPLVVPEVNPDALDEYGRQNMIASPNCSTIPLAVALKPIYDAVGISRLNVATYQSVSGSGKEGVKELADETTALMNGKPVQHKLYPQQIAFNVIPFIDDLQENGYTREEMKVIWEIQKIFADPIAVNATAVRVPVFYGHSAVVNVETQANITIPEVLELFGKAPGIKLDSGKHPYTTPVFVAGEDAVYVGRVREDVSHPYGLNFWVVSDNLRKGAALNSVQIAELLIERYL